MYQITQPTKQIGYVHFATFKTLGLWNRVNNIDDKVKSHPFITAD